MHSEGLWVQKASEGWQSALFSHGHSQGLYLKSREKLIMTLMSHSVMQNEC